MQSDSGQKGAAVAHTGSRGKKKRPTTRGEYDGGKKLTESNENNYLVFYTLRRFVFFSVNF